MKKLNLADLIAPVTLTEFFKSHWPKNPLFIEANHAKLENLLSLSQLQSLENVIAARTLKVRACLPDFDDEYSSMHLDPQDALKAFRNNMTLVFDSMQMQDDSIAEALKQIRLDLGLVTGGEENNLCKARSIVYATPAGRGTRMHFDANANFIIQLHGTKHWTIAPNTSVINPTERFTTGAEEMPAALETQCTAPLLDEMPEDAIDYLMEPGCVLYVPRGCWHSTTTDEDSLSLNFTFSQPSFADVFTKSLQEWLLKSPGWRELADGLEGHDLSRRNQALEKFAVLVKKLSLELPLLSSRQLLNESGFIHD